MADHLVRGGRLAVVFVAHPGEDLAAMGELADVAMYDEKRERQSTSKH